MSDDERLSWGESQALVSYQLRMLREDISRLSSEVRTLQKITTQLQVKAGLWGLIGGTLPVTAAILSRLLLGR